jgi:ATP-dependent RNA helicase RhlB
MGDLPQKKRLQVIEGIKSGKINCVVATEVAARGLHIDDLSLVINYDLPTECESYVHRIGRTARAGKSGKAITFACDKYVYGLEAIETYMNKKIPVLWADDDIFEKDKSTGMTFRQPKGGKEFPREKATRLHSRRHDSAESKRPKKMKTHQAPSDTRSSYKTSSYAHLDAAKVLTLPKRQHTKKQSRKHTNSHPGRSSTPEERIAYYKKKYGEDFKSLPQAIKQTVKHQETTRKESLLRKIIDCLAK